MSERGTTWVRHRGGGQAGDSGVGVLELGVVVGFDGIPKGSLSGNRACPAKKRGMRVSGGLRAACVGFSNPSVFRVSCSFASLRWPVITNLCRQGQLHVVKAKWQSAL